MDKHRIEIPIRQATKNDDIKDEEAWKEAISFMNMWLEQYTPETSTYINVIDMCVTTFYDASMENPTNGDYHDNQCHLHGLFSKALGKGNWAKEN